MNYPIKIVTLLTLSLFLISCEEQKLQIETGAAIEESDSVHGPLSLYEQVAQELDGSSYSICEEINLSESRKYVYSFNVVDGVIIQTGNYKGLYADSNCTANNGMSFSEYTWEYKIISVDGELGNLSAEFEDESNNITNERLPFDEYFTRMTLQMMTTCPPGAGKCATSQYFIDLLRD